jgi:hypothetical protein
MQDNKHGVCSLSESYIPTKANDKCIFLDCEKKTCKNCDRFENDTACMTAQENDKICCGFIDSKEEELFQILLYFLQHGEYSRRYIENLCIEFEQSNIYKFITEHKEKR